jgi:hypothetical protein
MVFTSLQIRLFNVLWQQLRRTLTSFPAAEDLPMTHRFVRPALNSHDPWEQERELDIVPARNVKNLP